MLLRLGNLAKMQSGFTGLAGLLRLHLQPGDSVGMQDAGPWRNTLVGVPRFSTEPVHSSASLPGGAGGSNPRPCKGMPGRCSDPGPVNALAGTLILYPGPMTVRLKEEIYLGLKETEAWRVQFVEARGWK